MCVCLFIRGRHFRQLCQVPKDPRQHATSGGIERGEPLLVQRAGHRAHTSLGCVLLPELVSSGV